RWGGGEDERPYLPRALSVARWREGEADFLLHDVGPGTARLCELAPGDGVWTLGPLGSHFTLPAPVPARQAEGTARSSPPGAGAAHARAILVGGGVGIAPLVILGEAIAAAGTGPGALSLIGFRDAHHALAAELLPAARIATDDGSLGHHGYVSDLLGEELARDQRARVYACGPPAMLEAVREVCAKPGVPVELSVETPMACGFGACHGCAVERRGGGFLRACLDGPVFDATLLGPLREPPDTVGAPDAPVPPVTAGTAGSVERAGTAGPGAVPGAAR
ncbi:MAG: hypothetical protein KGJ43_05965, partial [Acidobacteriota bacterium]|nr:hypothetical protein [Acidobacteriota bacterium]